MDPVDVRKLKPEWIAFIRLCMSIKHGEIDKVKVQDGVPVSAETVREKVRFT